MPTVIITISEVVFTALPKLLNLRKTKKNKNIALLCTIYCITDMICTVACQRIEVVSRNSLVTCFQILQILVMNLHMNLNLL